MRCEQVLYIAASVALVDADVQVGSAGRASLVLGDDRGGCIVDLVIGPQQVRTWRRARQLGLRQLAVAVPSGLRFEFERWRLPVDPREAVGSVHASAAGVVQR